jgi:hypothetical protein
VTSPGSAYTRLRRALDHGNVVEALASARELEYLGLTEVLQLVLLLLDRDPRRYGPAAVRWHALYCREARADVNEALAVLVLLAALRGSGNKAAASGLAEVLAARRRTERAAEVLVAWARTA